MNSRAVTVALVTLLVVAAVALGFTIGAGGFGGASKGPRGGAPTETNTSNLGPRLVINATSVAEGYLYASTSYRRIPSYMLTPLVGLKMVVTAVQLSVVTRPGRPPTYQVFTNLTGMAEAYLPRGNYSVQAGGADFNFSTQVRLMSNTTTYLSMVVYPVMNNVSYIQAVNAAPTVELGTSSVLYVLVQGGVSYSPYLIYQLIGSVSGSTTPATVTGTIEGTYGTPTGTMVVMEPSSPLQGSFVGGVRLLHFETSALVAYENGANNLAGVALS